MTEEPMLLRIATIGAPNGLRGLARLRLHTDRPTERLAVGTTLTSAAGPLTIAALLRRESHWYASFEGYEDRTAVEGLRGVELLTEPESEPDAWYPHELAGLRAEDPTGRVLGQIRGLEYYPAHDVLVLAETSGARTLVPFVAAIVPVVDVPGGRVVIDPPAGLLAGDADDSADTADTADPGDTADRADTTDTDERP
ncbi:ribosome maturation factor RimM [Pseudactinotalea sp. HY158]|uniref:ribosome maturation factor RimM n=1 Tax=Pseudactinotalea sp. HY158 TaxID=2654547 RepID=UPI00351A79CC